MYDTLLTKNPYFNASGLSSSQANYVCERIKERLKPIQHEIGELATHTKTLDGEALDNFQKVDNIDEKLHLIGELYAISAFLRTAIKEKEARLNQISQDIYALYDKLDEQLPAVDTEQLEWRYRANMDDYLLSLPMEEVVKYKTAEAKAAHIGKFIHNFDTLREALLKQERISFKEVGEQVFKIHHTPLYELNELQTLQAYLLSEHRQHESTVNAYKAKYQEFANQQKINHQEALTKAHQQRQTLLNERIEQETKRLMALKSQIAHFKIIVPNAFKSTIDDLLGEH